MIFIVYCKGTVVAEGVEAKSVKDAIAQVRKEKRYPTMSMTAEKA